MVQKKLVWECSVCCGRRGQWKPCLGSIVWHPCDNCGGKGVVTNREGCSK